MTIRVYTLTEPGAQTRARSLRMRSTIMRFSLRSFSLSRSPRAARSSASAVAPRAAVPLIGQASTSAPSALRKRSGDEQQTANLASLLV